jgi:hypothetical protein
LTVYRYVVRNPVEAGLCTRPGEWTWSSYPAALGEGNRFAFVDIAFMVSCCDGSLDTLRRFVESEAMPRNWPGTAERCLAPLWLLVHRCYLAREVEKVLHVADALHRLRALDELVDQLRLLNLAAQLHHAVCRVD